MEEQTQKECVKCGVILLDGEDVCPLCRGVAKNCPDRGRVIYRGQGYPELWAKIRAQRVVRRIILFLVLAADIICGVVNFQVNPRSHWSFLVFGAGAAVFHLYSLYVNQFCGYLARINWTIVDVLLFCVLCDWVMGFQGWSTSFALPSAIFCCNVIVLLLMIVNRRYWYSYMLYEIANIILSGLLFVLVGFGLMKQPILAESALIISVLVFLGTVLIGGADARKELERRFHI